MTPTSECVLAVVAYNEVGRIAHCLEAAKSSSLPPGFAWREWFLLDGGSSDGTVDAAREWRATSSLPVPLTIHTVTERRGLSADLAAFLEQLIATGRKDEIAVVVEADSLLLPNSIASLLQPFTRSPDLVATFGTCRVDDQSWGRWASGFQLDVSQELARLADPAQPRAMGRLFAFRVGGLRHFTIIPNAGGFDNQLSAFLTAKHLTSRFAPDAVVTMTPPTGYRDFYLQTSRVLAGATAAKLAYGTEGDDGLAFPLRLRAFYNQARKHPLRASAYLLARFVTSVRRHYKPLVFRDTWTPSLSTKTEVDPGS